MSKTFKTPKGSELPLMNLKGKDYLMVAYRLIWFTEENPSYDIVTNYLNLTDDQTVAHITVRIFNPEGKLVKSASGTKRETKKDFPDHTEKAETGALGRALAMLGYGTQFAIQDLDEGQRLADSPLSVVASEAKVLKSSFRKPPVVRQEDAPTKDAAPVNPKTETVSNNNGTGWE